MWVKIVQKLCSHNFHVIWGRDLQLQSPYTGVSTPPSPEIPKKSQKGVSGPPGPECQKSVEKVPEHWFWSLFDSFSGRLGLFRHFFDTPDPGGPGTPFWDFLGDFGPRGLGTPVYGGRTRKERRLSGPGNASAQVWRISLGSWRQSKLYGQ